MIKRVVLENWRTHARSEFEFEKGTNVLVGSMGSGKSSILDAMCFALFGTFPALQNRRLSLEEVITSKPNKEDFAKVRLEFDYNGKEFSVERAIKRKGTNEARVSCDGKLLAGPKVSDVTNAVENSLDIDYDLFSRAVYSEQNQIDFFLKLSPAQRKEQFDELLDLQKYEEARANSVSLGNKIKETAAERKNWVENQKRIFDGKEVSEIKNKIAQKHKIQGALSEKALDAKIALEKAKKEETLLEGKWKEFRSLKERLFSLQGMKKELEKNILETKKSLKGKSAGEIEKECLAAEKEILRLEKSEKEAEAEIAGLQESASSLIREQGLLEEKILQIEKALRELNGAKAHCPVCKSPLGEDTKKHLHLENEKEKKEIGEKQKELLEKMKRLKENLGGKNLEKKGFAKKRDAEREIALECKTLVKEIGALEKKENQLLEIEKDAEETEKLLEKTGFDEDTLRKKQGEVVEARSLAESLERERKNNAEIILAFEESLKKAEEAKKQLAELEESIKKLTKAQEKIVLFTNSLKAVQGELRLVLVENINIAMNDIWQKIYPYGDYTSARLEIEEGSYELKVRDRNENWVRVEGILSGGERSAAALCIRIAFSLVLAQNLSWLILDEPTHNLDRQSVSVLSKIMREQLPELVEQIFIITHDREMEKAASGSIYVLNRDKENDGATRPEKSGVL
ncbi:MAG: SMC family ATPase [Candidatus ainarchaeum sp.]|nr:SMC family ATPase [Candidatus ainarchaeum sp.]